MYYNVSILIRMLQLSRTRLILFIFLFSVCVFPFGNLFRFQISPTFSLLPLDVFVCSISLLSLPDIIKNLTKSSLLKGIFAFYVIGCVGLLISAPWLRPASFTIAALYGVRFLAYGLLLWIVGQLKNDKKENLKDGLLYSGFAMAIAGILQYAFMPDLRGLFFLGWDEHLFRLFGTLLDPNYSGAVFVVTLLLALDRYFTKKSSLLFAMVPLIATFLTYSRSSFLMLTIAASVFYMMRGMYKYAVLGIVVIVLGIILIPKNIRSEGVDLFRTASIDSRLTEYAQATEVFKEHPLFGVGFNAYRYAQLEHNFAEKETIIQDHAGAGVPNSFLFLLATTGIVGTVIFMRGIWYFLYRAMRQRNALIASLMLGLCIHSLFENTLFYPFILFQYMIVLGTMTYAKPIDTSQ